MNITETIPAEHLPQSDVPYTREQVESKIQNWGAGKLAHEIPAEIGAKRNFTIDKYANSFRAYFKHLGNVGCDVRDFECTAPDLQEVLRELYLKLWEAKLITS